MKTNRVMIFLIAVIILVSFTACAGGDKETTLKDLLYDSSYDDIIARFGQPRSSNQYEDYTRYSFDVELYGVKGEYDIKQNLEGEVFEHNWIAYVSNENQFQANLEKILKKAKGLYGEPNLNNERDDTYQYMWFGLDVKGDFFSIQGNFSDRHKEYVITILM